MKGGDVEGQLLEYGTGTYAVRLIKDGKMTEKEYYYVVENISKLDEEREIEKLIAKYLEQADSSWPIMKIKLNSKRFGATFEDFVSARRILKRMLNRMKLEELEKADISDINNIIEREVCKSCVKRIREIENLK